MREEPPSATPLQVFGKRASIARQACDACRGRKAKCKTSNRSARRCSRCESLDLNCTYLQPSRSRGPRRKATLLTEAQQPSDHHPPNTPVGSVETISANSHRDLDISTQSGHGTSTYSHTIWTDHHSSIVSPVMTIAHNVNSPHSVLSQSTPQTTSHLRYQTDELCSRDLLLCILKDYLDFVYPLIPVIHRPSFRADLKRNDDLTNKDFLGLLISICAVTVGTMPSKFNQYQKSQPPLRFSTRTEMIDFCCELISSRRDSSYFDELSHQKWAASYLISISLFQIGQQNRSRMVEVESMQLARLLGLHQISEYAGLNYIETQLRKKAFWLLFYGYAHSQLQSLRREKLTYLDPAILASINLEDLMPANIDDELIMEDEVLSSQHSDQPCLTTGFNIHSRVFAAALAPDSNNHYHSSRDSRAAHSELTSLHGRLHHLKYMLDDIPTQLRRWAYLNHEPASEPNQHSIYQPNNVNKKTVDGQFATMRANLHITQLWLQSILLDQIEVLTDRHNQQDTISPSSTANQAVGALQPQPISADPDRMLSPSEIWSEREDISRQLLHVLHNIPQAYLEPNGLHLTYKVRDVAVSLLNCPFEAHSERGKRATEYLRQFTEKLSRLDASETMSTLSLQSWVDTDRTRIRPSYTNTLWT